MIDFIYLIPQTLRVMCWCWNYRVEAWPKWNMWGGALISHPPSILLQQHNEPSATADNPTSAGQLMPMLLFESGACADASVQQCLGLGYLEASFLWVSIMISSRKQSSHSAGWLVLNGSILDRSLEVVLYPVESTKRAYCTINTIRERLQELLLKKSFKWLAAWMVQQKHNA